jgi:GT2 family glycosyltransferase
MTRTWTSRDLRAPWAITNLEMTQPLTPLDLGKAHGAYLLLRHQGRPAGRLLIGRSAFGSGISVSQLAPLVRKAGASLAAAYAVYDALTARSGVPPLPPLTIAICTRDRPTLLRRTLAALVALRDGRSGDATPFDILVVDNAPPDPSTRMVVDGFPGVRYAVEPVPGLNFGRNRALRETDRAYLGFIDDDAVPDGGWLEGLAESLRDQPEAGAFTGPVLPLALETEAQVRFEAAGGFGEGIDWQSYRQERWDDPYYPAGAGRLGTGTNMIFSTDRLRALGGFDEALDTGPPLPGGGDLDILFRLVRAGVPVAYSPRQAVHHEHRRDMLGLRRQFRSWGLSMGALSRKNRRLDPETAAAHRRVLAWLLVRRYGPMLARYPLGRAALPPGMVLAELGGLVQGLAGEYDRSRHRVALRRQEHGR